MSTVLINTNGGSVFQQSTDLVSTDVIRGQLSKDVSNMISLTDTDKRPILKPNRQVIDVVNDFSWYAGPKATSTALDKVPCVFLQEREQLLSSLISGALYYLNASSRTASNLLQSDAVKSLLGGVLSDDAVENFTSGVDNVFNNINSAIAGSNSDRNILAQNNLKSLEGIYFTRPTGFNYRLPMYNNTMNSGTTPGEDEGRFLRDVVSKGQDIVESVADVVNIAQPGTYIEKPVYFNNPAQGKTETVTFPLANTIRRGDASPIQQNYELLWLLAFQNKSYKTSFSRTPPPKIYSVYMPGSFSMPYAYISDMTVDFVGTTRKTSVSVPTGSGEGAVTSKVIQAPIPEAYQVSISFTSLISDYGNTMISDAFSSSINGNTVKVGR